MALPSLIVRGPLTKGADFPLPTPLIFDLAIAAVLVISILIGWSQGMMRGILTLAGTLLALTAASQISAIASDLIVEQVIRPATHAAIESRVDEIALQQLFISPLEEMEEIISAIENDLVREEARKLLASMGLSTEAAAGTAKDTLLLMSGELVDTVLYGAVREILSTLLCLLCFAVFSLMLRPMIWMIDRTFRLPILRQVNQLCGSVLGGVKGILMVLIAVWALQFLGLWITEDIIESSYLLRIAVDCLDGLELSPAARNIL